MVDFMLRLEKVPNELRYIIEQLQEERRNVDVDLQQLDWELVKELSLHHRVYPSLYTRLLEFGSDIVPTDVIDFLSYHYKRNTYQMLYLTGEMLHLSQLFSTRQIPLLFLKGPHLAKELYGDSSLRTSSDLDVLVPIKRLKQAEVLLEEQGYIKNDYIQTVLGDWKWRHHHVSYYHPEKKIKVELHWRLHPGPGKEPGFQELWDRREVNKSNDIPLDMLGKEDLFLFLIAHGSRHGWSRLRWLVDIKQMVNLEMDWQLITNILNRYHYSNVVGQALILVSQLFNEAIDEKVQPLTLRGASRKLAQEAIFYLESMINLHNEPVPNEVASYHKKHLFSLMSFQQKTLFMLSFLYPYPEDTELLRLPNKLHFLYFPLRPVLWLVRRLRKRVIL
ncbi:nucleotidyltransferase domain-containing protein [Ornithinibacillus californiensis]|uniref:nucleotidyltransferase domain-containing protein n=1 Tax=Ornithinibacillus californiensis TaxID=161536 RepID=UPI00064DDDA4|nr:nucleotidyltransferase family protein [Ornithinibacillus californiensis]